VPAIVASTCWGEKFVNGFFVPGCLRYVFVLHCTWCSPPLHPRLPANSPVSPAYARVLHCIPNTGPNPNPFLPLRFVNSAAHLWGGRPYDPDSNPSENSFVSIAALGEGWHNWHHKCTREPWLQAPRPQRRCDRAPSYGRYPFDYAASEYGITRQCVEDRPTFT
jgi:stearoyl-CoA desaturase (delta-9 desaturase)